MSEIGFNANFYFFPFECPKQGEGGGGGVPNFGQYPKLISILKKCRPQVLVTIVRLILVQCTTMSCIKVYGCEVQCSSLKFSSLQCQNKIYILLYKKLDFQKTSDSILRYVSTVKTRRGGPVDNRPSTDKLHQFVRKKKKNKIKNYM